MTNPTTTSAPGATAAPPPLPSYPTWRPGVPVLRRPSGTVQIGLDAGAVLIDAGLPGLARILSQLTEGHHISVVRRTAARAGLPAASTDALLAALVAAGLVQDRRERPARSGTVRLVGAGLLGRAIGRALFESPLTRLELVDDEAPDQILYPLHPVAGTRAEALRQELSAAGASTGRVDLAAVPAWSVTGAQRSGPEAAQPDLTVVAGDRLELDRVLLDSLLRADQPHLVVRGTGAGVAVGPFVLPGRTACVRCTDLVRRDRDPDWPALLPQLARTPAALPPPLVGWAASLVVTQVLGWLQAPGAERPETAAGTVELTRDFATSWRRWPVHPECGCQGVLV